jgi:hypothetical protein
VEEPEAVRPAQVHFSCSVISADVFRDTLSRTLVAPSLWVRQFAIVVSHQLLTLPLRVVQVEALLRTAADAGCTCSAQ